MTIAEHTAANSQNHRAMAVYEGGECSLGGVLGAGHELLEHLFVTDRSGHPGLE